MLQKVNIFEGDEINKLHHDITKALAIKGTESKSGDQGKIKPAREIFASPIMRGKGIEDILNGKCPKGEWQEILASMGSRC